MLYERRNGNFVLQITGHPNYGLPFGQDRIVPIYLATLAVRQKSQTIRFRTAAEMLETFGMHKGGKEYRRLVAAFERIFGATIFFGTDSLSEGGATVTVQLLPGGSDLVQPGSAAVPHFRSVWECDRPQRRVLPGNHGASDPSGSGSSESISGSAGGVGSLPVLSYRCFLVKGRETIPLFGAYGLASQLGSIEYARPRRFREKLDSWLDSIRVLWPECPAKISTDGTSLVMDHGCAVLANERIRA
jgi:hypothetical protein